MILLPAIDLLGGRCVRLVKGEYGTAHQVAESPLETALGFERAGAQYLHMVCLLYTSLIPAMKKIWFCWASSGF